MALDLWTQTEPPKAFHSCVFRNKLLSRLIERPNGRSGLTAVPMMHDMNVVILKVELTESSVAKMTPVSPCGLPPLWDRLYT